jgi:hypothetical protein
MEMFKQAAFDTTRNYKEAGGVTPSPPLSLVKEVFALLAHRVRVAGLSSAERAPVSART